MRALAELVYLPRPRRLEDAAGACPAAAPVTEAAGAGLAPEAYELVLAPAGVTVRAASARGFFLARQTLAQIRRQAGDPLPCGRIADAPDFPVRGVLLDISRGRVPTRAALRALVRRLAEWKFNQLHLYTEHTFAYRNHREIWAGASPLTAADVRALDACCREHFIDLVPNQNSFGHLERWLRHPRYRHLAECPDGHRAWGEWRPWPFSFNPLDPGALALLDEWYAELLPNFSSRLFNVGCDETVDLGQGRSREACARLGPGRVYLDFLLQVHARVRRHGRRMLFWADILLHHPELIRELPADGTPLIWGYEADYPFADACERVAVAGLPFYVCPGTSTWNALTGRLRNALANQRAAAEAGRRHGAEGFLVTDWGDRGHWQPFPFTLAGLAAGAGFAWAADAFRPDELAAALDRHVFDDAAGVTGRAVLDLADAYLRAGHVPPNSSALFWPLYEKTPRPDRFDPVPAERFADALGVARAAASILGAARPRGAGGELIRREVRLGAALIEHACLRALRLKGVPAPAPVILSGPETLQEYRATWRARCRSGGLEESVRPLAERLAEESIGC